MANLPDVLGAMLSVNNEERKRAELAYNEALTRPSELTAALVSCINGQNVSSSPAGMGIRMMAAVLLRQIMDPRKVTFSNLAEQEFLSIRAHVLQSLAVLSPNKDLMPLSRRLAHTVAQCATIPVSWPELLPQLCSMIGQNDCSSEVSLFTLEQLPDYIPEIMESAGDLLQGPYSTSLVGQSLRVSVLASKATCALVTTFKLSAARSTWSCCLPLILSVLSRCLGDGDETEAVELLNSMITIAQLTPDFFKAHLDAVVEAMMHICSEQAGFDSDTTNRALELLATLAETTPARMRRCKLAENLLPVTFELMSRVEEDSEWVLGQYTENIDEDEEFAIPDEVAQRFLESMGRSLLPTALSIVTMHSTSTEWQRRRAVHALLSRAADGCAKALKPHLANVVAALLSGISDSHPRVRFQAITGIARLADVFAGEFQKSFCVQVIPVLATTLSNAHECFRVRAHAASCVINVVHPHYCETEYVADTVDGLLEALCTCLSGCPNEVIEEALSAVSCIAQVTEQSFARFYPIFIPGLLNMLVSSQPHEHSLRGKALQCAGLIGEAVGIEVFRDDALQILQMLLPAMQFDPQNIPEGYFDHYAPACARISRSLKSEFVPFLATVMPPLLFTLDREIKFTLEELTEADEIHGDEEADDVQTQIMEFQDGERLKVSMNTTAVMEKQIATRIIFEYLGAMNEAMEPYVETLAEKLLPLVVFKYSENVRCSASFCVAQLFKTAVSATTSGRREAALTMQFLAPFVSTLIAGIQGEIHHEARNSMAEALRDVLQACFESGGTDDSGNWNQAVIKMPMEMTRATLETLNGVASQSIQRRQQQTEEFETSEELDEEDGEVLEQALLEEEELMTHTVDCIGYILKTLKEDCVAEFDARVLPLFAHLLPKNVPPTLRHNAICLFDDIFEFGGQASTKHIEAIAPILLDGTQEHQETYMQQACVYGLMQIAKHHPEHFTTLYQPVTQQLINLVSRESARDEENVLVTENCVSALGVIATMTNVPTERASLINLWISNLPIRDDHVEARSVHRRLCNMIEQGNDLLPGQNYEHLPKILMVFGELLEAANDCEDDDEALTDPSTRNRISTIVQSMQQTIPGDALQAAWSSLSDNQQHAIQASF